MRCLHSVNQRVSTIRSVGEQLEVELLTAGQPSRIVHDAALNLLVQSLHVLVIKRDFTAHQNIDDDAKTPHIYLGARVSFGSEELGCGKIETPTESLEVTAG